MSTKTHTIYQTGETPVLPWWDFGETPVLPWWDFGETPVLPWWDFGETPILPWWDFDETIVLRMGYMRRPAYRGGKGVPSVGDINEHDKIDLVMNFNF